MTESEIIILPADIYQLFVISEPPENLPDFGSFGCTECQEPIGPNKPEGIADLPPYVPKKPRLSNDNMQQQQPNHNRQQHNKFNFQRGGKFKQQQQHQQQQQQQQKKIISTVEISPEFANRDLGTWAKKSPSLSPASSTPSTQVKFTSNFNPEKAPNVSPFSSASFNPQLVSSNKVSPVSSSSVPQTSQPQQAQPTQPQQQSQLPPSTHFQPAHQQPKSAAAPSPSPPPKAEPPLQKHSSGWGNVQSKPKTQSFAQLLNEESSKPSTEHKPSPTFKPETISHPTTEQTSVPNDDKDWPSFASINKPKKNSPWGNIKP
ncbi:hypothetical protein M9Y10_002676 [Tritrichomonas musculus]|uniref:Uncharacterized protein n=1 Tax=Tritrichomonas musculus TaxID=1915356 RepID=A0ABR2LCS7_9EUKA